MDWMSFTDKLIEQIPEVREALYYEAKTFPTYGKAKKFVRDQKNDTGGSYNATAEEIAKFGLWNAICDDVLVKLAREADNQPINK